MILLLSHSWTSPYPPYLDFKTASTIVTSIVHSKLDYCNSLYHNLSNYQFYWLQRIQNSLARAVVKASKSSHITPILKSFHWLKVNERIDYKRLSLTYKVLTTSQPIAILTIWSLFKPIAVAGPHLLSPFLAHQPSPHWKSQIAHSVMHHPVSGINSVIHSVSIASHISTHLLIHLSAHLYYHHHAHHPSLLHSFTPGSKPTFLTNPSHLRLF